uniref:Uncharacterized protein n=1 Tax=Anguilla anguilla TaxID=7936 RepID=A0A0E9TC72_ANGAN
MDGHLKSIMDVFGGDSFRTAW